MNLKPAANFRKALREINLFLTIFKETLSYADKTIY